MARITTLKKAPINVETTEMGTNIEASVSDGILTLKIDLTARHGKSASGKTTIVATSSGNQKIPGTEVFLGLNAYVKE